MIEAAAIVGLRNRRRRPAARCRRVGGSTELALRASCDSDAQPTALRGDGLHYGASGEEEAAEAADEGPAMAANVY
jgi:hypothetical protein